MRDGLSNQNQEAVTLSDSGNAFANLVATRRDVTGPTAQELGITREEALKDQGTPWIDNPILDAYIKTGGAL